MGVEGVTGADGVVVGAVAERISRNCMGAVEGEGGGGGGEGAEEGVMTMECRKFRTLGSGLCQGTLLT